MSKEKQKRADGFEQIEEATISTEQFIEKNQKILGNEHLFQCFFFHRGFVESIVSQDHAYHDDNNEDSSYQ